MWHGMKKHAFGQILHFLVFWTHLIGNWTLFPMNLIPDHKSQNWRSYGRLKSTHRIDSFKITFKFLRKFSRNFGIWPGFFIPRHIVIFRKYLIIYSEIMQKLWTITEDLLEMLKELEDI